MGQFRKNKSIPNPDPVVVIEPGFLKQVLMESDVIESKMDMNNKRLDPSQKQS